MRRLSDIIFSETPLILPPSCSVADACKGMRDRSVGAVLIVDENGVLKGIFSGRDAVGRVLAEGRSAEETSLADVMTSDPSTLSPKVTAMEALRLMWDGGFRHIPIIEDGKIIGIVSRGDFSADEEDRLEEERELWEHAR